MSESVALTSVTHAAALAHLVRRDGQEDVCFGLWFPSQGRRRHTALLHALVLPGEGDRIVHGNVAFQPAFFRRALTEAIRAGAGLAVMHSHPGSGWQGMSDDDIAAERDNAAAVLAATGLPMLGLTLAARDGTWSARLWPKVGPRAYERTDCESARVVGDGLAVSWHPRLRPPPVARQELTRTVQAWGAVAQADLERLHVGVIGAGSVGSVVIEGLARMGVQRITVIDFDRIERHNLDRVLHATPVDATSATPKVLVAARAAADSATSEGFAFEPSELSVCEDEGYRLALDCDLLFSCVDRPWARSILNFIAYAHLVPVIDGGVTLSRTGSGRMRSGEWRAHVVGPERRCMACNGQYEPGLVGAERQGLLEDATYIQRLPEDHPFRANQNVFVFATAAASLELLQLILLVIGPGGVHSVGGYAFRFPSSYLALDHATCEPFCPYPLLVATGEHDGAPGTGRHVAAERARARPRLDW